MSISPLVNPFRPYVEQHLTPLQGKIVEWLAGFDKTLDDVAWWEVVGKELLPYQFFGWRVHITVVFVGSEAKHGNIFIIEMLEGK